MPLRSPAGYIRIGYDPLKVPDAPTIGTATGGDASASVAFTAPTNVGGSAISEYQAVAYAGSTYVKNTTGTSSPISVTGLTNGTAYTFQVWALNTYGPSPWSAASNSVTPSTPQRGVWGSGDVSSGYTNVMYYITITSTGNSTYFGDLTVAQTESGACASATRGVFGGGNQSQQLMTYITILTTGNATTFGNLPTFHRAPYACANSTRGLFAGGYPNRDKIDYITIASTGDGTTFGSLSYNINGYGAGCASPTRGIFAGGYEYTPTQSDFIEYVTIASTGNASFFGYLTQARHSLGGCSSNVRGVFGGGSASSGIVNTIDYITIASTGNATNFGQLTVARLGVSACSSNTRGVFGGGYNGGFINVLDYVTIASTGNATDFGDLYRGWEYTAACSNCSGGVQ